jgi:AraC-like DNA-binding protein
MLIAPTKLRGDLLSLAELGTDPRTVLQGTGVSYEQILSQVPLSLAKIGELYEILASATPEDFAVICGRSIRLQHLGLLGYRLSNCSTVGKILEDWAEQCAYIDYPLRAALSIGDDEWCMTFVSRYPMPARAEAFCMASTLAGFTQSLFNLSGYRIRLRQVGFPFPAPAHTNCYADLDSDELLFDCPSGFVAGARVDLDLPVTTADENLLRMCDDLCQRLWSREPATTGVAERLSMLFADKGVVELSQAGSALGMGARSLQRHLAAEGTSYQMILDDHRRERALHLIRRGDLGKTVAYNLGFEDVGSFRRLFRRWTGMSVTRWRNLNSGSYAMPSLSASLPVR